MALPSLVPTAQAQTVNATAFAGVVGPVITYVINPLIELAFAIALIAFIYGVLQMVIHGGSEEARTTGKNSILYGLIGMVVMIGAWGIIYLVANTVKGI